MNFTELSNILKIGVDAARFVASVVPSLIELWEAHDQKTDVVIAAIDAALILKRAANDRALEVKHQLAREAAERMNDREDEPTSEHGIPKPVAT